jgi:Reverse transcriptase (RNA-dependent DNA polymerase)
MEANIVTSAKLDPPERKQKHSLIVNSGSTAHYCTTELPVDNKRECTDNIRIKTANGGIMQATHTAELKYPNLPEKARRVYIVPELAGRVAGRTLISVGQLCDAGCKVIFEEQACKIQYKGETVLYGWRGQSDKLWQLDQPIMDAIVEQHEAAAAIHSNKAEEIVRFMHATMGYPTIATLRKAIMKGFVQGFPGLTLQLLARHPPISEATYMGHMKQTRKNVKSTKKMEQITGEQPEIKPEQKAKLVQTAANATCAKGKRESENDDENQQVLERSETPVPQSKHQIEQLYETANRKGSNSTQSENATVTTTEQTHSDSTMNQSKFIIDDKKENGTDEKFPEANGENGEKRFIYATSYQPVDKTYADATGEFVIQTKSGNKLIYILYHYDSNYIFATPINSTSDAAQTKAFDQVYSILEKAGMAPKLHILDNQCGPKQKDTLAKKGMEYQLVPSKMHQCNAAERAIQTFKSHFISILCGTDRNCPIIIWDKFVRQAEITMNLMRASRIDPSKSAHEQIHGKFNYNRTPMAPIGQGVMVHEKPLGRRSWDPRALKGYYVGPAMHHYRCFEAYIEDTQKTRITDTMVWLQGTTKVPKREPPEEISKAEIDEVQSIQCQLTEIFDPAKEDAGEMRVGVEANGPEMRVGTGNAPPMTLPPVATGPPPKAPEGAPPVTFADATGSAGIRYRKMLRQERQRRLPEKLRNNHAHAAEATGNETTVEIWETRGTDAEYLAFYGHAIDPDTKKLAEFRELINSSDAPHWWKGMEDEFGRLMDGTDEEPTGGTNTMEFVKRADIPKDNRPEKEKKYRVRITVGGDRVIYEGEVSTKTADLATVKVLLNSVISTKGARYMTLGVKDFYLNTTMKWEDRVYLRFPEKLVPESIKARYKLGERGFIEDGWVYLCVSKGMYGLKQAGRLANEQLTEFLAEHGYKPCPITSGLWKHKTRPIAFTLVVDDFGVKYENEEDLFHLIGALKMKYKISEDRTGSKYCGMKIDWDYQVGTCDISMPGYVERALQRFQHEYNGPPEHAPQPYTTPQYGARIQYAEAEDETPTVPADQIKRIQEIIGVLLYYARAVDSTLLVALGTLASEQTKATELTMRRIVHLLNYCATNPEATVRFKRSEMVLHVESDASYLCLPKSKSRVVGYYYMGERPRPDKNQPPINGAVQVVCNILRVVVSSAAEAELAGLFYNAKETIALRTTLEELGHEQPPTPIVTDNSTAAGIANDTVK